MKSMKGKKQVVKKITFDPINGVSPDGTPWELFYNWTAKRYTLLRYEVFFYSHISLKACKRKAADKEVVWR